VKGGGYGYGLFLHGSGDRYSRQRQPARAIRLRSYGYASAAYWADPEYDLVGVML
jgi:hypothetical protein